MPVRRIGTRKDAVRRGMDAAVASLIPGGFPLARVLALVDGYLYPHEAVFLSSLARKSPGRGAVVEIGSFRGRSTLCLAIGLSRRGEGQVVAVDPHLYGTQDELRENLDHFGVAGRVRVEVATSEQLAATWKDPVRVLFVDGNHLEAGVASDVEGWLPFVEPGGFLVFHDSTDLSGFEGPRKVAKELLREGPRFDLVGRIGSISWGRLRGGTSRYRPPQWGKRTLDPLLALLKVARGLPE